MHYLKFYIKKQCRLEHLHAENVFPNAILNSIFLRAINTINNAENVNKNASIKRIMNEML